MKLKETILYQYGEHRLDRGDHQVPVRTGDVGKDKLLIDPEVNTYEYLDGGELIGRILLRRARKTNNA